MHGFNNPSPKRVSSVSLKYIGSNGEEKDNILDTFLILIKR